jgi:hypothetical protein
MGNSVAGKIRIDLLANSVQFTTEMKSAGKAVDGFAAEYERSARRISQSQKSIAADIERRQAAWGETMKELRPEIRDRSGYYPKPNSADMLGWYAMERSTRGSGSYGWLRAEVRNKSMSPLWGSSYGGMLGREEAEWAAARGAEVGRYSGLGGDNGLFRSMRGLGQMALGRGPMGMVSRMGMAVEDMSAATKGLGVFAAVLAVAHKFAAQLGKEIKNTREEAIKLGKTYDQLAAERGMPKYSRFTEGGALAVTEIHKGAASAVTEIHKGAKGIGAWLTGAAVSGADWLFSGGGLWGQRGSVSAIADVARQEEESALWVKEIEDGAKKAAEAQKESAERAKEQAAALARVREAADSIPKSNFESWEEQVYGRDVIEDREYRKRRMEEAFRGGRTTEGVEYDLQLIQNRRRENTMLGRANAALEGIQGSPLERYKQAMADAELRRQKDREQHRMDAEVRYWKLRRKALEDYYSEEFGLNAKRIQESLMSPTERFGKTVQGIQGLVNAGLLTPDQGRRATENERDKLRGELGIKDPLKDFSDWMKKLSDAANSGFISPEEFNARREEMRRETVAAMIKDRAVSPVGAMEYGSQAAHQLIANAMVASPQLVEAKKTNAILDQIERNLRNISQPVGEPFYF